MNQQENAALTERAARRALYSSLFSIVACAMMLFGTTFAWFTANQTSGVNTMTAANFDVSVTVDENGTPDSIAAGTHTVKLTRTGGGTAPGYCVIKLAYTGTYDVKSGTVTYTTDQATNATTVEDLTVTEQQQDRGEKKYYAEFDGTIGSVSFTVDLMQNYTAEITAETVSWGEYPNPTPNAATPVKLMARRTFSAAPQPTVTQITDGAVLDTIGHEDVEDIKIETITIEKPAAGQAEENKNDEDGLKDGTKVDAGNGNKNNESSGIDSNGGADSGSDRSGGSGSSGSGSGAGGSTGESSGGEGGGNVSGGESSGGGDAGNGDAESTGDAGSTGNGDEA